MNRQIVAICQALCNGLTEQLHQINFCRQRLDSFGQSFRTNAQAPPASPNYLLPAACPTPEEAVQKLLSAVSADDVRELDRRMQKMVQTQFVTLANICLSTSNLLGNLEPAMLKLAAQFLAGRMGAANGADQFFERYPDESDALAAASRAFDAAVPPLGDTKAGGIREIGIVVMPPGKSGEQLTAVVKAAVRPFEVQITEGHEDVAFYRELPRLPLARLPQLGSQAREAYQHAIERDRFSPHTRTDVETWQRPTG